MTTRRITPNAALISAAIVTAALVVAVRPPASAAPQGPGPAASTEPSAPAAAPTPVEYVGSVKLEPARGPAGTSVTLTGTEFDPSIELSVTWNTVQGSWVLKGDANEEFHGREFVPATKSLGTVRTDASGRFETTFTAPRDFGFYHDVTVEQAGVLRNKAAFRIDPTVTVEPRSGPPGTPITIRMEGVGWANLENSWLVTYDNQFTGLLSAVTTDGVATAVLPATGGPGKHLIRIVHGSFTVPYLNMQQSPRPDRPTFTIPFRVTSGDPILPDDVAAQALPPEPGEAPSGTGPAIWTDPASGPVGTPMTVGGRGLDAGSDVTLRWTTVVGNRVGGDGWEERTSDLGQVAAGADGSFEFRSKIPDDLGGPHRLEALVGGAVVAETSLTITPSVVGFSPTRGPVGTEIEIHLKGVGWTETANIYNLTYDNGYLGYACGFNTNGDVVIYLPASGGVGWHFIDLYPGIYKGKDAPGVQNFRIPQLTYAADHPGERLPAFRFAFEVTP